MFPINFDDACTSIEPFGTIISDLSTIITPYQQPIFIHLFSLLIPPVMLTQSEQSDSSNTF